MGNITSNSAVATFLYSLTLPSSLTALGDTPGCHITYMLMQDKTLEQDMIHYARGGEIKSIK